VTVMSHPLTNRRTTTWLLFRKFRPGPKGSFVHRGERKPVRAVPGH